MNNAIKRAGWLVTALGWTLGAGMSAVADDVELFSAAAPAGVAGQPNVLFILDTSGSMSAIVNTQTTYDPLEVYPGQCESIWIFYTKGSNTPNCSGSLEDAFPEANNQCEDSWSKLDSVGQWKGEALQWNPAKDEWTDLKKALDANPVECKKDQGQHGNGGAQTWTANTNSGPWAMNDNDKAKYNDDYTLFHGNWLNWFFGGRQTEDKSRIEIVQQVINLTLDNVNNVNIGLMRFNNNEGGPVVYAM